MKRLRIPLRVIHNGVPVIKHLLIDSDDAPLVLPYKWHIQKDTHTDSWRAYRRVGDCKGGEVVSISAQLLQRKLRPGEIRYVDGDTLNCSRKNMRVAAQGTCTRGHSLAHMQQNGTDVAGTPIYACVACKKVTAKSRSITAAEAEYAALMKEEK